MAILVVNDFMYDRIWSVDKVDQNPANLLLEIELELGVVSVLTHRVCIDPADEALHVEDNLSVFLNRLVVDLSSAGNNLSYSHDHCKLVNCRYL